jgi:hypothetical protein
MGMAESNKFIAVLNIATEIFQHRSSSNFKKFVYDISSSTVYFPTEEKKELV